MFGLDWNSRMQKSFDKSKVAFEAGEKKYGRGTFWRFNRSRVWLAYLVYKDLPQIKGVDQKLFNFNNFLEKTKEKDFHAPSGGYESGGNEDSAKNNYIMSPEVQTSWYWVVGLGKPLGSDWTPEIKQSGEGMKKYIKSRRDYFALATQMAKIEYEIMYDWYLKAFWAIKKCDYNGYVKIAKGFVPLFDPQDFAEAGIGLENTGTTIEEFEKSEMFQWIMDAALGIEGDYITGGCPFLFDVETIVPYIVERFTIKEPTKEEIEAKRLADEARAKKVDDFFASMNNN
ncbi:hypothetical protein [Williamsoniiplasma lucivorax]|uniref:Uncharacterized protein n=1 Tax=Williamsoniiplasma lucivorax TaxID=209274 RepID=A0A2S5R920_9MOLU|nr:hypothetical protein [Williamsoniiplasma lucivorax]PPE03818.1 hypothetical protein ELUCI_v1c09630 [Williamsoniiplasma lucivorax]